MKRRKWYIQMSIIFQGQNYSHVGYFKSRLTACIFKRRYMSGYTKIKIVRPNYIPSFVITPQQYKRETLQ